MMLLEIVFFNRIDVPLCALKHTGQPTGTLAVFHWTWNKYIND